MLRVMIKTVHCGEKEESGNSKAFCLIPMKVSNNISWSCKTLDCV